SPLVGLYFSLEGVKHVSPARYHGIKRDRLNNETGLGRARPAVWVLNPGKLNHIFTGREEILMSIAGYDEPLGGAFGQDARLSDFLPPSLRGDARRHVPIPDGILAVEPMLSNRRLQSQDGCFTVHGHRGTFDDLLSRLGVKASL